MNLRDLNYLVALAEHKHFGRAAEAAFVSQPTLSTQIMKLEEELGVALVERTPRKVLLTEVGREIVQRARDVLNEVEQIRLIARRTLDPESGTLRLGIFPTLGPYLLPHVIPRIRERFPRLELLLVEEKTEVILRQLREGRIDAGILARSSFGEVWRQDATTPLKRPHLNGKACLRFSSARTEPGDPGARAAAVAVHECVQPRDPEARCAGGHEPAAGADLRGER